MVRKRRPLRIEAAARQYPDFTSALGTTADMDAHAAGRVPVENDPKRPTVNGKSWRVYCEFAYRDLILFDSFLSELAAQYWIDTVSKAWPENASGLTLSEVWVADCMATEDDPAQD